MNKNEDKWTKSWKERLDNHTEPVPEGLWVELEQELSRPRVIPFYRRYAAVAAVAVLVVLSTLSLWWMRSSSVEDVDRISREIASLTPVNDGLPAPASVERPLPMVAQAKEAAVGAAGRAVPMLMAARALSADVQPTVADTDEKPQESAEQPVEERKEVAAPRKNKNTYTYDFSSSTPRRSTGGRSSGRRWEVGMNVGNGSFGSESQGAGYRLLSQEERELMPVGNYLSNSPYSQLLSANLDNQVESHTKHKMPVTFGISVRFHLNDRWALESGLTYTKLASELWAGAEDDYYESNQKLHYVGIPVKASYRLWENERFSLYASAGGAVEKCVSGEVSTTYILNGVAENHETNDLEVKELQWSVAAAVGAQVKLTRHLGLYIEPGVNYYFKDGSAVETIRKEHPLNFNLQTGLRLSY